jgi:2-keto-4-pentenoate hydratase/2-oxohepta-3-ene-1,7-dioic acid hydratase in catechol pathway
VVRLIAHQDDTGDRWGLLDAGGWHRTSLLGDEPWTPLLDDAVSRAERAAAANRVRSLDELRPRPALRRPGKIVCVGLNYGDHAREGGRAVPKRPLLFAKFASAIIGDGEAIIRPEGTRALDLEVELGVVIGRRARRVTEQEAMSHVAGYVVVNDVSARDWQGNPQALREGEKGDGQWLRAKGSDTFLPVGAVFVTPDEVDPERGLRLRSWRIPGSGPEAGRPVLMQDGNTSDMLFRVPALVSYISRHITLDPGDLIAPARRPASACSAIRRCSSSRATASGARSRASAWWRIRSSTGPTTPATPDATRRPGRGSRRRTCSPWSRPSPAPAWSCRPSPIRRSASTTS